MEPEQDQAFRAELRAWLAANVTEDLRAAASLPGGHPERVQASRRWQRILHQGGWVAPGYPGRWGGRDASPAQAAIFHEETALAGAPNPVNAIGIWNIGPMLLAAGTEEQKRRWIPPMLSGEQIWCQGFSEPDAGSDLASLTTRATPADGGFVVEGQKIWTSFADIADLCLALVRTDVEAPKHKGITTMVIDMRAAGVTVRPIKEITGDAAFSEIFFDAVHVPAENVVGPVNDGWRTAMSTLTHERMGTTALGIQLRKQLDEVIALARRLGTIDSPLVRDRLVRLHIEIELIRSITVRAMEKLRAGEPPAMDVALGKLQWSRLCQDIAALAVEMQGGGVGALAEGADAAIDEGRWQRALLWSRMTTIAAGTTEVQKNTIAIRELGLPRG